MCPIPSPPPAVQRRRHVLGVTSVWLLVPVVFLASPACVAAGVVTCAVSTCTYAVLHTRIGRPVYLLDKACAPLFFSLLFASSFPPSLPSLVLAGSTCLLFAASRVAELTGRARHVLCLHLSFRFCGYWWVSSVASPSLRARHLVVETAAYWCHAAWAARHAPPSPHLAAYARGVAQVGALAAGAIAWRNV